MIEQIPVVAPVLTADIAGLWLPDLIDADLCYRLTITFLHFIWQGAIAAGLAAAASVLFRHRSAALRYNVNLSIMVAMVCSLIFTFAIIDSQQTLITANANPRNGEVLFPDDRFGTEDAGILQESGLAATIQPTKQSVQDNSQSGIVHSNENAAAKDKLVDQNDSNSLARSPLSSFANATAPWVAMGWLFGAAVMSIRLLLAVWGGRRLIRSACKLEDQQHRASIARLMRRVGLKRMPDCAWCERIAAPVVVGILKPAILLPLSLKTGMTALEIEAVIAHEFAHIRRLDLLVNLFQRLVESILFFHPAVWYVSRRVSIERENCCDDLVISEGCDRFAYANALLRMAELSLNSTGRNPGTQLVSLSATGTRSHILRQRILRILGNNESPRLNLSAPVAFLIVALLVTTMAVGALLQNTPDQDDSADSLSTEVTDVDESKVVAEANTASMQSEWTFFRGDARATGVSSAVLPEKLKLLWKHAAEPGEYDHSAVIVDGVVFVGDYFGKLRAIDLTSGDERWSYQHASAFNTAPAVIDGKLLIGDDEGKLLCFDTGKMNGDGLDALQWTFTAEMPINASVNFYKDRIVFGSEDANLYCVSGSGMLLWTLPLNDQIRCAPSIVEDRAFIAGCDSKLHVIDLEKGEIVRQVEIDSPTGVTPAIHGDHAYVGTEAGEILAINWKTGDIDWRFSDDGAIGQIRSSAAVTDSLVIFGSRNRKLYALDRKTGRKMWISHARRNIDAPPVVCGERVFVGAGDGRIYGFKLSNGVKSWEYELGGTIAATPAVVDGKLVITNSRGGVFCFGEKPKPEEETELSKRIEQYENSPPMRKELTDEERKAALEQLEKVKPVTKKADGRFDLRLDKTPLREVIQAYADGVGYAVEFPIEAKGTITHESKRPYSSIAFRRFLQIEMLKAGYVLDFDKSKKSFVLALAEDATARRARELKESKTIFDGALKVKEFVVYREQQKNAPQAPGHLYELEATRDLSPEQLNKLLAGEFSDQITMLRGSDGLRIVADAYAVRHDGKLLDRKAPFLKQGERIEVFENSVAVEWNAYDPNPPITEITGKITDEAGEIISGIVAEYMIFGEGPVSRPGGGTIELHEDGSFEIPIRKNQWTGTPITFYLMAKASGFAPAQIGPIEFKEGKIREPVEVKLKRGFTGMLQFDSADGASTVGGIIEVASHDMHHTPLMTLTSDAMMTKIPNCGDLPLVLEVRIPGFEEQGFTKIKFTEKEVTRLTLKTTKPAKLRLMSSETGEPIVGAKLRRFNKAHADSVGKPYPMAGINGPVWGESDSAGEVELSYLAGKDPDAPEREPFVYWFYVEAENYAGKFIGPIRAGQDFGEIKIGRPLEVKGELRFDPAKFQRVSAEWDQPTRSEDGASGYAISKELETPVDTGVIPFHLTGLRHDTVRVIVRFGEGTTSFSYANARRVPSKDDIVFEVDLKESIEGVVITPEGIKSEGTAVAK